MRSKWKGKYLLGIFLNQIIKYNIKFFELSYLKFIKFKRGYFRNINSIKGLLNFIFLVHNGKVFFKLRVSRLLFFLSLKKFVWTKKRGVDIHNIK